MVMYMTTTPAPRTSASTSGGSGLRVDAERNRQRIIATAREVFAEQGLDVPMEDIARQAIVGVGTLYRRYPTRADLIAAAFEPKMTAYAQAARDALADPDPWHGFCGYVERICAMQAGDRGFTEVLTQAFPGAGEFEELREQAYRRVVELFDRAKAAGRLRPDFSPHDFPMLLMANAGVVTATAGLAPTASPRLLAYLLQAFSTEAGPLPPPPTFEQMTEVLLRFEPPRRDG